MTTQRTVKNIRICCYVALFLCVIWAVFYVFVFSSFFTGKGGVNQVVDWSKQPLLKISFFVVDILSLGLTIGLCVKATLNFLKGIRKNMVFPKSNVKLFFWLALTYFIHRLCWSNHPVYYREEFTFGYAHTDVVIPFCILFFAFMYKLAADAVEENSLTI